jgi:glutamyl-tRNA synthetase
MTPDEILAMVPSLGGDFKAIDAHLRALDKHLTLRSYLGGYALSEADTKVWVALRSNKAAFGFVRRGSLPNLTRWFTFVEVNHPEIQSEVKTADASRLAKQQAASKAGGSYNISLPDAEQGVVTRFLPEPSFVHPSL